MSFERAARIANAVLLEGYVLYPYRATSTKNRYRWTFGVLAPRHWSEAGGCEPWWLQAQVLVRGEGRIRGRLRFLRVVDRRVEVREGNSFHAVEQLDLGDRVLVSWEEGDLVEIDFELSASDETCELPIVLSAREEVEPVCDPQGRILGRIVRKRAALGGRIEARRDRVASGGKPLARLSVRIDNLTPFEDERGAEVPRTEAVRSAFVSTHLLLAADVGAEFLSLLDPPEDALAAAASCANIGTHPVLAGEPGRADLVLASPIILYDHPAIAPESPGEFFDSSEIDGLLALRTRTLTPDETRLARATDRRAAEVVDRALALNDAALAQLHGVSIGPSGRRTPFMPAQVPGAVEFRPGMRVRLRLNDRRRRTDVQDILFAGRSATIEAVRHDVDGRTYLAVTIDDDPAVEMHRAKGRFHYYYCDEVDPL